MRAVSRGVAGETTSIQPARVRARNAARAVLSLMPASFAIVSTFGQLAPPSFTFTWSATTRSTSRGIVAMSFGDTSRSRSHTS
jgi:hypothetical protein